jgi:DNA replication and repair protein RecF
MWLQNLELRNFKNIREMDIDFSHYINCIVGENGSGKTNLLDAIHYLCLTRGIYSLSDHLTINFESDFFRLVGYWDVDNTKIKEECIFSNASKKIIKIEGAEYEKLSEHIGKFPLVVIAPDDTDLIREGSEIRRKFFDGIICQLNPEYLTDLITYNYLLKQRNALLKKTAETGKTDGNLFESYDVQLITIGKRIFDIRTKFIQDFIPVFENQYDYISSSKESSLITYLSDLQSEEYEIKFKSAFNKDLMLQRTTQGIHTDDYDFFIDDRPVKKTASQGQRKSFVIALKLAQFEIIANVKNRKPLLLLDDIFDKLDDARIEKLIQMIINETFGQVFITDARPERSKAIFGKYGSKVKTLLLLNGQLQPDI